ncbi:MAG: complex I subunit 1 family protein, partial [Candidatus Thermoplasmatota archaeon]
MAAFLLTDSLINLLAPYVGGLVAQVIAYGVMSLVIVSLLMGVGGIMSFVLRKVMARVQTRLGPNRVGPFGLLQFLADAVKMIGKEPIRPAQTDKWAYELAPYLVIVPVMLAFVPVPFGQGILISDIRVGILFIIAISAIAPLGEIIAGWASNNKYSTYGAVRAASLDISYEVPMVLAAASVILLAGTMST